LELWAQSTEGLGQVVVLQRVEQRAIERSASVEAIAHLEQGLALAGDLPDAPKRRQLS